MNKKIWWGGFKEIMEWKMLEASKKLFPHWLDKSDDSNFMKHLKIINKQQTDIRHKLKTLDWSRLLNKPFQIHKTQTEPYKWKVEFKVNVPRLKKVNIYKNPIIVNNEIINNFEVTNGYFYEGKFYKNHNKKFTNLSVDIDDGDHHESEIEISDNFTNEIVLEEGLYYHDLLSEKYYKYVNSSLIETKEENIPQNSLIHSESFIDNYSHFSRYIHYEDNSEKNIIYKYVVDENNELQHKIHLNYTDEYVVNGNIKVNVEDNGKYEFHNGVDENTPRLYFNVKTEKYGIIENDEFKELDENEVIYVNYDEENDNYYYVNNNQIIDVDISDNSKYYIFTNNDSNVFTLKIPLIETENITPIISDDRYVLEVFTWDDFHFMKGFPEIDFIDYNNNNIIDDTEKTYDNINISIKNISNIDYLTFRVHQYGIKLIEIFKDDLLIHKADFVIEKLGYSTKQSNDKFAHIYDIYNYNDNQIYHPFVKDSDNVEEINYDVDEYVYRWKLEDSDKIFDEIGEWNYELKNKYTIKVTYMDSYHQNDSDFDKTLSKTYTYEDSVFYHDISLDMIGKLYNVPRHVFSIPSSFENREEEIEFYSKTYPTYCNSLLEDDYHYQKRLEYYINNYNKKYFPELELWKYYHIDSTLVNRKVIIAEQDNSYMRTLDAEEDKYINELSKNKLDSFYLTDEYNVEEEKVDNIQRPKYKSHISDYEYSNNRNRILIDKNGDYIKDIYGNYVYIDYDYYINKDNHYIINYKKASRKIQWFFANQILSNYQIQLIDSLRVVPNTSYQLRFCVKEYPKDLTLKIIYKNNNGDVRDVEEILLERKDYEEIKEYNELVYTDYKKEWGIECEYLCNIFRTINSAQNIELCLESKEEFQISDITLQRIIINHYDSEYMKTSTDYNSCVYDLYANYNDIPSNIRYTDVTIFNKILNRSLPLSKVGYFNFQFDNSDMNNNMGLSTQTNIYLDNLLTFESGVLSESDNKEINTTNEDTGKYEHTYNFNKYIKKGEYEIVLKSYYLDENNIVDTFNIDVNMLVINGDNTANYEKITITDFSKYYDDELHQYIIPFENKSDNSFSIRIYNDNPFSFKDFKLIRKDPLTMEELIG